jgi:ferrous iron transport protein A
MTTLAHLKIGERARISDIQSDITAFQRKLLALGLVPGAEIALCRVAPLGDPLQFQLNGGSISLRQQEAKLIQVRLLNA